MSKAKVLHLLKGKVLRLLNANASVENKAKVFNPSLLPFPSLLQLGSASLVLDPLLLDKGIHVLN